MARRARVPRHKGHTLKRNKNPKLSPFQRELKRARLANQPPTAKSQGGDRDIPHSQRKLSEYLLARQKRAEARRSGATHAPPTDSRSPRTVADADERNDVARAKAPAGRGDSSVAHAQSSHTTPPVTSLNEEFKQQLGLAPAVSSSSADHHVESVIARKKARKHAKKQEARRERVAARLASVERELATLTRGRGDGATTRHDGSLNLAFERELRRMEKTNGTTTAAAKTTRARRARGAAGEGHSEHSADAATSRTDAPTVVAAKSHTPPPAREFYELVDVVRYGERVEAPPTFDRLPDPNAAVSRLAQRLGEHGGRAQSGRTTRGAAVSQSTGKEMQLLRERVMAAYQRNKRNALAERKGVDLKHIFPRFS